MSRLMRLLLPLAGFAAIVSLDSMTTSALAARNCPAGATCKCVRTTVTDCRIVAGKEVCTTSTSETCTPVSGRGSGKRAQ